MLFRVIISKCITPTFSKSTIGLSALQSVPIRALIKSKTKKRGEERRGEERKEEERRGEERRGEINSMIVNVSKNI